MPDNLEQQAWIPVAERLPEFSAGRITVLGWDGKYRGYCLIWAKHMMETWEVTHWMPLPEPPLNQIAVSAGRAE